MTEQTTAVNLTSDIDLRVSKVIFNKSKNVEKLIKLLIN